uniref:Uncharacterized protein n=1 Tax=Salmo trutta TaxID=8032 RepID=A0A673WF91_SALTR
MKLSSVVVTLILTVGVPYYIYTPLPAAIEEPLKLMLLDAFFRAINVSRQCNAFSITRPMYLSGIKV